MNQSNLPFFSVVTEVYNREKTIKKTIESILNQTFQNFEYIIIDFDSEDNSRFIIENILNIYNHPNVIFLKKNKIENEIERWNTPISYAKGKYIVNIEGDDWIENNYLNIAQQNLINNINIGLYVGRRFNYQMRFESKIENKKIFKHFLYLDFAPPPSEVIFIRLNKNNIPFKYDELNYIWAAEYSLYREILLDNYDVYFETEQNFNFIHRGISYRKHSIKHVRDIITIFNQNKIYLNPLEIKQIEKKISKQIATIFAYQILQFNFEFRLFKLFIYNSFKSPITVCYFLKIFMSKIINFLINIFNTLKFIVKKFI